MPLPTVFGEGYYEGGRWFQPYGRILANELAADGRRCNLAPSLKVHFVSFCWSPGLKSDDSRYSLYSLRLLFKCLALIVLARHLLTGMACQGEIHVCGLSGKSAEDMALSSETSIVDVCGVAWKGISRVLKEDGPFELAILMAGTNDMTDPSTRSQAAVNLLRLHIACHEMGVPTVAVALPPAPCADELWWKNRETLLKQMASLLKRTAWKPLFIDPASYLDAHDALLWDPDGLHLSQLGSVVLGKCLGKVVMALWGDERRSGTRPAAFPISRASWARKQCTALHVQCSVGRSLHFRV